MKSALITAVAGAALIAGMPSASAQLTCAELGGTVDVDQVCHVHSTAAAYSMDIDFPLGYPDEQAVAGYLEQSRADFLSWVAEFGGGHRRYLHDVTAEKYQSSGTQSLVLTVHDDTGLGHEDHPGTTYQAFNYDAAKHVPITVDTLFKPGTDPVPVLNSIVGRKLDGLDATTYRNFAITDDAVIFFFGEDEIVADNDGPHQVSVPRSELAPLLA
ncbi:esterase [Mycobacterium sp. 3519A]|uniref:esterase n=1 Tax=Mycobacterium sp. 3519A TaxID=2057184 RepID=UPI001F17BA2E|nr:esterase [Mycobacterium sp. 3519A]